MTTNKYEKFVKHILYKLISKIYIYIYIYIPELLVGAFMLTACSLCGRSLVVVSMVFHTKEVHSGLCCLRCLRSEVHWQPADAGALSLYIYLSLYWYDSIHSYISTHRIFIHICIYLYSWWIYTYTYIHMCIICASIFHIYIYREREREKKIYTCIHMYRFSIYCKHVLHKLHLWHRYIVELYERMCI